MFEQATLSNGPASKRALTTFAGVTTQAVIVTGVILGPMVFPQVLPKVALTVPQVFGPRRRGEPEPKQNVAHLTRVSPRVPDAFDPKKFYEPRRPPDKVLLVDDIDAAATAASATGFRGGATGDTGGDVLFALSTSGPPVAPPPRAHIAEPPAPIVKAPTVVERVQGGLVSMAQIIRRVEPVYPPIAKISHISGTVELEGIIGVDGRMIDLRVKSGHPVLAKAAYEAVIQWIYRPTTLNGKPVEVIAPITVTFHLN